MFISTWTWNQILQAQLDATEDYTDCISVEGVKPYQNYLDMTSINLMVKIQ